MTASPGFYCLDLFWSLCTVAAVHTAFKGRNHFEGGYWYNTSVPFVRNGWDIVVSDTTLSPSWIITGCWCEYFDVGINLQEVSTVNIYGNQIFRNVSSPAATAYGIFIDNAVRVVANGNIIASGDPVGSTTHGIVLSDTVNGEVKNNTISGLRGGGIYYTGTSSYCNADSNEVNDVQGNGVLHVNDSSNAATNSFRNTRSNTIPNEYRMGGAMAVSIPNVTFVTVAQAPAFRVVVGEEYQVTACLSGNSVSGNQTPSMRMREFNHRPAAPIPYDVFKVGNNLTQVLDSKAAFSGTSVRFMVSTPIRIVGTADDALFQFDLNTDTGGYTAVDASCEIKRL
jgi:parallel beta-helix repeat protein